MAIREPLPPAVSPLRRKLTPFLRLLSPRRWGRTLRYAWELAGTVARRRAEPRLTVGVDVNALYEAKTGIGWYLESLLQNLAARDDLRLRLYGQRLTDGRDGDDLPRPPQPLPEGPAIERVVYRAPDGLILPPWRVEQLLRRAAPLLVALDGNRVLFAPNFLIPPLFRFARASRVATVHDLSLYRLPWAVRPDARRALAAGLERTFLDADLILTLSRAVRDELVERGLSPQRLRPIHLGPGQVEEDAGAAPLPIGVPERYALHVGTLEPRKNLPLLLAAWKLLRRRRADTPPLVLCGGFGWHAEALRGLVAEGERDGSVVVTGYVEPPALRALYRRAMLVAVPSLYEGFGLTVAEAMAASVPLVVSDIPVLREVAGDAALYAPTDRADRWAEGVGQLLDDAALRERLIERGRERKGLFDWRTTAEETARALQDAAAWR